LCIGGGFKENHYGSYDLGGGYNILKRGKKVRFRIQTRIVVFVLCNGTTIVYVIYPGNNVNEIDLMFSVL
jgi:hypothetical protein